MAIAKRLDTRKARAALARKLGVIKDKADGPRLQMIWRSGSSPVGRKSDADANRPLLLAQGIRDGDCEATGHQEGAGGASAKARRHPQWQMQLRRGPLSKLPLADRLIGSRQRKLLLSKSRRRALIVAIPRKECPRPPTRPSPAWSLALP